MISIAYLWCNEIPTGSCAAMLSISRKSITDWYQYCRDICSWKLLQNPVLLGGPNVIVQIDQSLVRRRQYNLGHVSEQQQIFGLYDTNANVGHVQFVADRTAATLLPIIQQFCMPNTIIHSDMWAAYNGIVNLPGNYRHNTVNHSRNFVNPLTGTHTNNVEAYWSRIKRKLKYIYMDRGEQCCLVIWMNLCGGIGLEVIKIRCLMNFVIAFVNVIHYRNYFKF